MATLEEEQRNKKRADLFRTQSLKEMQVEKKRQEEAAMPNLMAILADVKRRKDKPYEEKKWSADRLDTVGWSIIKN